MFRSYEYIISFFFIITCYSIIIPTIEAQPNTTILTTLETRKVGNLPQGSIINYVYNIGKNVKGAFPSSNSTTILNENVFITITTCKAPLQNLIKNSKIPPANQLEVWISTESKNPGPILDGNGAGIGDKYTLIDGYLNVTLSKPKNLNGLYIGVYAPKLSDNYLSNDYYYEIGASADGFKHQTLTESGIFLDDTDKNNALLRTFYTGTELTLYDTFFVESTRIDGISMSFCAYRDNGWNTNVTYTRREKSGKYQSSIFISNLNNGTKYSALITEESTDGIKYFTPVNFQTQSQSNCVIIKNLEFCDEVFYAVPKTVSKNTEADLSVGYDNLAKSYYNNFSLTINQYPCNDADSRYSLVRNCDDCRAAYKDWICAVTIPRCAGADLSDDRKRFKARVEVSDQSMKINQPFTELVPCIDLCYNLTRSCPAAFSFNCPDPKIVSSYGYAGNCNSLGMDFSSKSNAADRIWSSSQWTVIILILGFIILIVGI